MVISRAIRDVQDSVREGESLATPLSKHATFPAMVVQMMAVGEETGALDTMLSKVADFYDQEVEAAMASLTSMIEPILIAVMGACVGGMVIALYMPLFNIIISSNRTDVSLGPGDIFCLHDRKDRVLVQQSDRPVAVSAEKAAHPATLMVMVDVEWALPARRTGADCAESVLFAEQFLVVGQANPVERFEIGIPDVACFGERCHVAEPIPAGGGRPPAL
jgi:hypothetical protein